MLTALFIQNIALIKKLDLIFDAGMSVLTGETGAGKSIILNAMMLALGGRFEKHMLRQGAQRACVVASFDLDIDSLNPDLEDYLEDDKQLIFKREITLEGRSRAYINDIPVTLTRLKEVAASFIEIQSQDSDIALFDKNKQLAMLDDYADHGPLLKAMQTAYLNYVQAQKNHEDLCKQQAQVQQEEDLIRHAFEELNLFAPVFDEEESLDEKRQSLLLQEKNQSEVEEIETKLCGENGVSLSLNSLLRRFSYVKGDEFTNMQGLLEQALDLINEAEQQLTHWRLDNQQDISSLEKTEERLFEYRRLARKYQCLPSDLEKKLLSFQEQLQRLEKGDENVAESAKQLQESRQICYQAVMALRKSRVKAIRLLETEIKKELPDLKLSGARFRVILEERADENWQSYGGDDLTFEVEMNKGNGFSPLHKTASGGERARLLLALKLVLSTKKASSIVVFDEIDKGMGGATASAVGRRLAQLGKAVQLLTITHSPQVAAFANHHFLIEKTQSQKDNQTSIHLLNERARQEELARMLSGDQITQQAVEAARQLVKDSL